MELPAHPDSEDPPGHEQPAAASRSSRPSRATAAAVAIVVVLFVLVIVLHLAGVVGPRAS